jgi:neurofibromin 1
MTLPANSLAFVFGLSQTLARNAPYLTLEFLKEWTIGFGRADVAQKTACLQYVGPWISNLEAFASPSRDDAEESCKQVAEIIRSLIAITGFERKVSLTIDMDADWQRLQLVIQEHVWARLAEKNEHITDIVLTELVDAAMGGGMGSERADCVAEILHVISTTAIRGQLIARLRKVSYN